MKKITFKSVKEVLTLTRVSILSISFIISFIVFIGCIMSFLDSLNIIELRHNTMPVLDAICFGLIAGTNIYLTYMHFKHHIKS